MFLGEFQHNLDEKGRLAIPARYREELGERFIITRGFDRCLIGFPMERWEQVAAKADALSLAQSDSRQLRRALFANAEPVEFDRQGRVLISQNLRDYAGLDGQVAIVGNNTFFEIWSRERWQDELAKLDAKSSELAEGLASLGL
jgi:MraZ protein